MNLEETLENFQKFLDIVANAPFLDISVLEVFILLVFYGYKFIRKESDVTLIAYMVFFYAIKLLFTTKFSTGHLLVSLALLTEIIQIIRRRKSDVIENIIEKKAAYSDSSSQKCKLKGNGGKQTSSKAKFKQTKKER